MLTRYYLTNEEDYFGEIINNGQCLLWAIKKNRFCDYIIQTIIQMRKKEHRKI